MLILGMTGPSWNLQFDFCASRDICRRCIQGKGAYGPQGIPVFVAAVSVSRLSPLNSVSETWHVGKCKALLTHPRRHALKLTIIGLGYSTFMKVHL